MRKRDKILASGQTSRDFSRKQRSRSGCWVWGSQRLLAGHIGVGTCRSWVGGLRTVDSEELELTLGQEFRHISGVP